MCDRAGAVLVFDEISIGWRLILGGSHLRFGVQPDIAVFAKAMGNGHPMAAIIGRADVMQAAQESFISSTYWTEGVGPVAALATMRKMQRVDVPGHMAAIGTRLRDGTSADCRPRGRAVEAVRLSGDDLLRLRPSRGPGPANVVDGAHVEARISGRRRVLSQSWLTPRNTSIRYLAAAEEVFAELGQAVRQGDVASRIGGPVRHSGFARLA